MTVSLTIVDVNFRIKPALKQLQGIKTIVFIPKLYYGDSPLLTYSTMNYPVEDR